jgi:hypothetical protein
MRAMFGLALAPFTMGWALLEAHIWLSIAAFTALTAAAWMTGNYQTTCVLAAVTATLLMRVDAVTAAALRPAE